jgi:formate dehydrogenase
MADGSGPQANAARPAPGEDGVHITFCRLCEALCGLAVEVREGRIVKVGPDRAHPISEGHLCVKGARMLDIVNDPDRVLTPLRRRGRDGEFEPVSWDEALDDIASRLKVLIDEHGGGSIASYLGNPASFATMHPAYIAGFHRAIGSDKRFNSMHVDTGAKHVALEETFGDPIRFTFPDLEDCDFLIIIGGNPAASHMSLISEPLAMRRLEAIAGRGGVVVVDPRRTETARRFEHMSVLPDSDAWLMLMLLRTVFEEELVDAEALDRTTIGWRELAAAACSVPMAEAVARCGVDEAAARSLARRFATARTAACYARLGAGRGRFSSLINLLVEALNVVTGRFGQAGGWVIGRGALQGAPFNAAPYGSKRSRIGDLPLLLGAAPGGALADDILTPGEGQVRALFVDAGNPVISHPRGDRLSAALETLDLLVALDLYVTETSRHAHYILPAATFLERPDLNDLWGANAPRPWIQYSDAVTPPRGEARTEFDIYAAILARLGLPGPLAFAGDAERPDPGPIEAADIKLRAGRWGDVLGEAGLSVARLRAEFPHGVRFLERVDAPASWEHILFEDRKPRLFGHIARAELARLLAGEPEPAPGGFDLKLFGRRRLQSLNSWMHNSARLTHGYAPTLQIHPADARDRQIADGQAVRIASAHGVVEAPAEVTDEVVQGSVCYPHGWGHNGGWRRANDIVGVNINLLASDDPADWEQVSGVCLLDGIPVTVAPA